MLIGAKRLWRWSILLRRYALHLGFACLLFITVWAAVFSMISHEYSQSVQMVEQTNDLLVRGLEEHVRRSLHAVDETLMLLKTEYERAGVTPAITTIVNQARRNSLVLQVTVVNAEGIWVAGSHTQAPQATVGDREFFQRHAHTDSERISIGQPFVGRFSNKLIILTTRRFNAPDGSFGGLVAISVDPAYFSRFYQDMGLGPGRVVRIVGLDGVVRAGWGFNGSELGRDLNQSDLFRRGLQTSSSGHYLSSGGTPGTPSRYFSYRTMPDYPLVVQVGIDAETALAEYRQRREKYLGIAVIASLTIVAFVALSIRRSLRQHLTDERWRLVVDGVNDGVWDWDAESKRMFVSDRCKAILGYEPAELEGRLVEWTAYYHPEEREKTIQALKDHMEGHTPLFNVTQRMQCKNGSYRWVRNRAKAMRDDAGQVVRVLGTMTDIQVEMEAVEARQASERELYNSREKYKTLIDQAFEAVALLEPNTLMFIEVNARFTEWLGYSLPEDEPFSLLNILTDSGSNLDSYRDTLGMTGYLPAARRTFRHKNGALVFMERTATLVNIHGSKLVMMMLRNISEQLQQEEIMRQDAMLARRIQQALLPPPLHSEHVDIEILFCPCGDISGDLYHLEWQSEGKVLRGYLIDAPGHGLTTALYTSALSVLLHRAAELDMALDEQLHWLDRQIPRHFGDAVKVLGLAFEIDIETRELRFVGAGMPYFWAAAAARYGRVEVGGSDLGAENRLRKAMQKIPLSDGDLLYFTTGGLSGMLLHPPDAPLGKFRDMVQRLASFTKTTDCSDDATAVCIRIKSLPQAAGEQGWPKIVRMNGYYDYQRLNGEVAKIIARATGQEHSLQEVAVNEAIANALECRDGRARNQKARIKFNLVGHRLIVRVKTTRIGFAGNALLRRLRSAPEAMFAYGENDVMGRGIPMMLTMAHTMTYNSEGTEVLLAWKLDKGQPG